MFRANHGSGRRVQYHGKRVWFPEPSSASRQLQNVRRRSWAIQLASDCRRVGIDHKRATHVARRTFITLALAGGASESWLRRITHNANGDVLTGYQVNHWQAMCETVACVKVERQPSGTLVRIERTPSL